MTRHVRNSTCSFPDEGTHPERSVLEDLGTEIVQLVSKKGTSEQWAEWLRLPLFHAAEKGNRRLVDKLIEAGASGEAGWKGHGRRALLHPAAVGGNEGVLDSLIKAGAEPDVNVLTSPPYPISALWLAIVNCHEAVARRLVALGADVNFKYPKSGRRSGYWSDDTKGLTILHLAIMGGHEQLVEDLILRGADVLARDDYEATALMLASRIGVVPVLQALVRCAADVNARDDEGASPLHVAAKFDQAGAVDVLIEAGADIELKESWRERTPLGVAADRGKAKSLLALLRQGASVNAQDDSGKTPLFWVCYCKPEDLEMVVELLLRWGADETIADQDGRTPASTLDIMGMFTGPYEECSQEARSTGCAFCCSAPLPTGRGGAVDG